MSSSSYLPAAEQREQILLAYVADLELEVDRLRKQTQHLHQAALDAVKDIYLKCAGYDHDTATATLGEVKVAAKGLATLLQALRESPGFHPAHDQITPIAIRPLVEQVFCWQQRFLNAPYVSLHLELSTEYMEWFPVRLRHILDNLISNGLRYRDPTKGESRLSVSIREVKHAYELRVTDNGRGFSPKELSDSVELFHRSAPARSAGLGVGLAVVKVLVEQSGGTLTRSTDERIGTTMIAVLPRFDINDYLDESQPVPTNEPAAHS